MTKFLRMLGAAAVTVVAGSLLLGASGAFAQSPPSPPSRFVGSVTVNGQAVTSGVVTAQVNGNACGSADLGTGGAADRYKIDVPAADPAADVACGTDGDTVVFFVDGVQANETGTWHNYDVGQVDLTVTAATETPTETPTVAPSETPTGTATVAPPTKTPQGPNTGSGVAGGSSSAPAWLFALLGLGAVAFGVGGVAAAKRHN